MTRSDEQLMLDSKMLQHLRTFLISSSLDAIERVGIHVLLISQAHQTAQMWKNKDKVEFSSLQQGFPFSRLFYLFSN